MGVKLMGRRPGAQFPGPILPGHFSQVDAPRNTRLVLSRDGSAIGVTVTRWLLGKALSFLGTLKMEK
jgi:hypothetical protein